MRPKRLEGQNWRALLSAGIAPRTGKAVDVDYSFEAAETQNRKPSRQVGAKNAVLRFRVRLDGPATPGALVGQLSVFGTMRVSRSETRSILGPPVPDRPTLASTRPIA